MRKFRLLQEPIRLQDLLNSARSRAEKKIMCSITSKLNSTFGTIDNATADKMTTKVVSCFWFTTFIFLSLRCNILSRGEEIISFLVFNLVFTCVFCFYFPLFSQMLAIIYNARMDIFRFVLQSQYLRYFPYLIFSASFGNFVVRKKKLYDFFFSCQFYTSGWVPFVDIFIKKKAVVNSVCSSRLRLLLHRRFHNATTDGAIIQFVLIKWCGVYSNQWIIKGCFGMCTALRL